MKKIIGIGNALTDILAVLKNDSLFGELNIPKGSTQFIEKEQVPEVNKLFSTMKTVKVPGGSTANTIRALAQIGVSTGFIGKIGHAWRTSIGYTLLSHRQPYSRYFGTYLYQQLFRSFSKLL